MLKRLTRRLAHGIAVAVYALLELLGLPRVKPEPRPEAE
jgi:hypothetical protein